MSLGERLREARQTRGLSLEGVAAKLGTSYQTIWRYEHDERNPPGASLYGLAAFYGRTVEWLLGEEATMAVPEPEDTNGNGTTHVAPKLIPIVGRILSTGQVADWQEHVGTVEVPTFVTAEAPRCFALQVDGDAPSRHGIREGDTAVVDPDSEFIDGRMYIVQNQSDPGYVALYHIYSVGLRRLKLLCAAGLIQEVTRREARIMGRVRWSFKEH
jgi:transcriptional regulator with XRE-family HTH domain